MKNDLAIVSEQLSVDQLMQAVSVDIGATSNRVYQQTYRAWKDFCESEDIHPLNLIPDHVVRFLSVQVTTKTTRKRQLSALRKLAAKAHTYALLLAPENAPMFEAIRNLLKDAKVPEIDRVITDQLKRKKVALSPAQVDKVLRVWDEPTNMSRRNRALIAVLFFTGVRRAEAVMLRWEDIDFENGVLVVEHGKGDKERTVPIAGDYAVDKLKEWHMSLPSGRVYVFCPIERQDIIGGDRPLRGNDVWRIVKQTQMISGIEFKPHDCRRTYITEMLATGTPIHEAQKNVGHARGDTTLGYAQTTDARTRRKNMKLRYGS